MIDYLLRANCTVSLALLCVAYIFLILLGLPLCVDVASYCGLSVMRAQWLGSSMYISVVAFLIWRYKV